MPTDAEKRDVSLRTVELPDCCGNCRHWDMVGVMPQYGMCRAIPVTMTATYRFQLCDLHERRDK